MLKQIFILSFLLPFVSLYGQKTVISGKAPDYGNKEISFYTIPDPVLHQKIVLGKTTVAPDGQFSVTLTHYQTIEIYSDLEKYRGSLVVEPGKNYQVTLPPFSLRTSAEAHSNYFKPALYWLGLPGADRTDLNFAIRSFVSEYNHEIYTNTVQIYQKKSRETVNGIMSRLKEKYKDNQNQYFKTLVNYSFAELEYVIDPLTTGYIIKKYFATEPVQMQHPDYQRMFQTVFTDFLHKQSQDIQNRGIIDMINSGKYPELVQFYEKRGYTREFAELVVLKGLNDGYYSGRFSKEGVLKAIESAQNSITSGRLLPIAQQVRNNLVRMAVGGKAPSLRLLNLKNELVSLEKYRGKYVFLSFFNSRSSDCRRELDSIVPIEKKFRQVLTMVSVSVDDNFDSAVKLWKEKGYTWELLNGAKRQELIANYKASITPAFYLIDPEGKIQLSPAPFPSQDFEPMFLRLFRNVRFRQQRN